MGTDRSSAAATPGTAPRRIVLVGNPNVGKSALFNRLTGAYVVVSNYPGTTVDVSRGTCRVGGVEAGVEDTPGMYSLLPITEEERVARDILLAGGADAVVHVVDAKNLPRMLPFTLQLAEAGLPLVLVLNMIDEAERLGIRIDAARLEEELEIPVVPTSALSGRGVADLVSRLAAGVAPAPAPRIRYGPPVETAVRKLLPRLPDTREMGGRALALLLLQGDPALAERLGFGGDEQLDAVRTELERELGEPACHAIPLRVHREAANLCSRVFHPPSSRGRTLADRLSEWTLDPVTGIPLLAAVLYFGLYKFVGGFGAGTLVDLLEGRVFEAYLNPWINGLLSAYVPWQPVRDLIGMEYGVLTLGLRYAIAIILPIVGTFFVAFSILEDSGYLPRLAMLSDRLLKRIGLNGRAVIPLTLGFGCDTMATMVTRTLETRRERVLATLLLALAIPCSAQLGVILGMMAQAPAAMAVWAGFILLVFLGVGTAAARLLPGDRPVFYMELPPLRLPRPAAVFTKTYTRMQWYFLEILPLFLLASVLIWLGKITRAFDVLVGWLSHVMGWIGLPSDAAVAFLFGFFRRDFGAAGLYDLQRAGALTGNQLAVAAITLTLFVPCIAQFLMMKKERGWGPALGIAAFVLTVAFLSGGLVNALLTVTGVQL